MWPGWCRLRSEISRLDRVVFAVLLTGLAAIVLAYLFVGSPKPVLGPYREQHVISVERSTVTIVGTLCARRTVTVTTGLGFQAFHPPYRYPIDAIPGAFVSFASGIQQIRAKGCVVYAGKTAFRNPIPDDVQSLDLALDVPHKWRVIGQETTQVHDRMEAEPIHSTAFSLVR